MPTLNLNRAVESKRYAHAILTQRKSEVALTAKEFSRTEKRMPRVKVNIERCILKKYADKVRTGVPSVAYIRLDSSQEWSDLSLLYFFSVKVSQ